MPCAILGGAEAGVCAREPRREAARGWAPAASRPMSDDFTAVFGSTGIFLFKEFWVEGDLVQATSGRLFLTGC